MYDFKCTAAVAGHCPPMYDFKCTAAVAGHCPPMYMDMDSLAKSHRQIKTNLNYY